MKHLFKLIFLFLALEIGQTEAQTSSYAWAVKAGGSQNDAVKGIIQVNDETYVTGSFSGTVSFGNTILTSSGGTDIFIAKYDANGTCSWAKKAGGTGNDEGLSIGFSSGSSTLYITGYFSSTSTFPISSGSTNLISQGMADIFIYRMSTNGNGAWARRIGSLGNDIGKSIAVERVNNADGVYVTGSFSDDITFPTSVPTTLYKNSPVSGLDMFVAKYNQNALCLWAVNPASSASANEGNGIAVFGSDLYVTGYFNTALTFGGNATLNSAGIKDIFVAKFNSSNGTALWSNRAGGVEVSGPTYFDTGNGIVADVTGVYVTGKCHGSASFGNGKNLNHSAPNEAFLAKYDYNGITQWVVSGGTINSVNEAFSVATDGCNGIYITGHCGYPSTFYGVNVANTIQLNSVAHDGIFIAKYNSSGYLIWAQQNNGPSAAFLDVFGYGITVNPATHVIYVAGTFQLNPSFGNISLSANGNHDAFITRLTETDPLIPQFIVSPQFCEGSPILVDGSASSGETMHNWTITESDAWWNTTWNPATTWGQWYIGQAGPFNISAACNFPLQCGKYYRVQLALSNCSTPWIATTQLIYIKCKPAINAGTDKVVCPGQCALIGTQTGVPGDTYTWTPYAYMPNPSSSRSTVCPGSTTTYVLTVANNGCTAQDNVIVYVVKANAGPDKTVSACGGYTTLGTPAIPGVTYYWSKVNGSLAPGELQPNNTVAQPTAYPASTTTYRLNISYIYTDDFGTTHECDLSDEVIISTTGPNCRIKPKPVAAVEVQEQFNVYPNPSNGNITVSLPQGEERTISIYNLLGDVIYRTTSTDKTEVDISAHPKGIYFVKATDMQGNTEVKKIIHE